MCVLLFFFFFSSRRRHTRWTGDWSSDVCSSDLSARASQRSTTDGGATLVDRWEARADGDDARSVVVRRMATRLAFELAKRSEERRVGKEGRSRGGWEQ